MRLIFPNVWVPIVMKVEDGRGFFAAGGGGQTASSYSSNLT